MAVFDDYSNSFNQQMLSQMQSMQQNQAMTAQVLAGLNQKLGTLGSNIVHSGINAITGPIKQDTSNLMNTSMGLGSAAWNLAMTNPNNYSVEQQRQMALNVGGSAANWAVS